MIEIIPFTYEGTTVRTVTDESGEAWFVAADIGRILEMTNVRASVALLDDDERGVNSIDTPSGAQEVAVVNEPGLYSLILRSRKPEARTFKRWVTHEVIPSIRKTGGYGQPKQLTGPELMAAALLEAQATLEAASKELETTRPKADAYDAFMDADGCYSIGAVGKMLGYGQGKFFDELKAHGILIAKGAMRNTPYQKYAHHFRVNAYTYERKDGNTGTSYTTKVRPSGVDFIRRKLSCPLTLISDGDIAAA